MEYYVCGSYGFPGDARPHHQSVLCQTREQLDSARRLLTAIASHEVNAAEEAEKWLREDGWPNGVTNENERGRHEALPQAPGSAPVRWTDRQVLYVLMDAWAGRDAECPTCGTICEVSGNALTTHVWCPACKTGGRSGAFERPNG